MLGTNIILEENQNDGRSKNSEVKEEESTDRDSKLQSNFAFTQLTFTCSKSTIERLEKGAIKTLKRR